MTLELSQMPEFATTRQVAFSEGVDMRALQMRFPVFACWSYVRLLRVGGSRLADTCQPEAVVRAKRTGVYWTGRGQKALCPQATVVELEGYVI